MPEMDGLELVQAIRRDYPALPVILMTAMGSEDVAARALHHGAASYVRKRSLAKEIVRTVGSVLGVARALLGPERALDVLWWSCRCHYMTCVSDAFQLPLERENVFATPPAYASAHQLASIGDLKPLGKSVKQGWPKDP